MQTYSLTFPNSDPITAVRPDRLAYLITAIACSAKVPVELVYISYIRANGSAVNFVQPPHNVTGVPTACTPSLRARRLQIVATPNMLVTIYYISPAPANPSDAVIQNYAASITGSAAPPPGPLANNSGVSGLSTATPTSTVPSAGAIVGIACGVAGVALLAAGMYTLYINRQPKRPISKSKTVTTNAHWMSRREFNPVHLNRG